MPWTSSGSIPNYQHIGWDLHIAKRTFSAEYRVKWFCKSTISLFVRVVACIWYRCTYLRIQKHVEARVWPYSHCFPMDFYVKNKKKCSWVEIPHFSSTLARWLVLGGWLTPPKDMRGVTAKALVALWSCAMKKGPYRGSGVVSYLAKSKLKFWIQVINFRPRPL